MRWPVMSGISDGSSRLKGVAIRTGQVCIMNNETGPVLVSISPIGSVLVYSPSGRIEMIFPDWLGGTMIRCVIRVVSFTVPSTSPPETFVLVSVVGTKCHFLDRSIAEGTSPRLMNG